MKISMITLPYHVDGWDAGTEAGPAALLDAGLMDWLLEQDHEIAGPHHVQLTPEEDQVYGAWNRIGLANAHLARLVGEARRARYFPLILESNCYAAVGVLAGLQKNDATAPPRIGLVWIDAHGDFNTPETTPSGMLSGMPVAIVTGLCLHGLRRQAGLDPAISPRDVVMVGVRATDPLEQESIERYAIEVVPTADIRSGCDRLRAAMSRLSDSVDLIYIHFDIDALDASEVASMWLSEPDGPLRTELAAALQIAAAYPKVAAFGIADINPAEDVEGQMLESAMTVIQGAIAGLAGREARPQSG
ncbi:MAG: arginase family protein [Methylococcaceae bacterium]|nr:arginase family protein [Methylococcaceae bacterium]MCI0733883.1 arginase family protein [Methylococcaceae bacterium]